MPWRGPEEVCFSFTSPERPLSRDYIQFEQSLKQSTQQEKPELRSILDSGVADGEMASQWEDGGRSHGPMREADGVSASGKLVCIPRS